MCKSKLKQCYFCWLTLVSALYMYGKDWWKNSLKSSWLLLSSTRDTASVAEHIKKRKGRFKVMYPLLACQRRMWETSAGFEVTPYLSYWRRYRRWSGANKQNIPAVTKPLSTQHIHPVPVLSDLVISCVFIVSDSENHLRADSIHYIADRSTCTTENLTGTS